MTVRTLARQTAALERGEVTSASLTDDALARIADLPWRRDSLAG